MMSKNPFNCPEIRARLALFVSVKDAISCVQVSKAFSQDFAYPIWHTVDFGTNKSFVLLQPSVLMKYGHHIRVVKRIQDQAQLNSLMHLSICKLSSLHSKNAMDAHFQAYYCDLIRRNRTTLTQIEIHNGSSNKSSGVVFLDSLMTNLPQSSKLTLVAIRWLTITRETLTSILRCCQALTVIELWGTDVLTSSSFDDYQHRGVKELRARVTDTFQKGSPPLFVHFPNLERWETGDETSNPLDFPSDAVKDSISNWCPKLRSIGTNFTAGKLVTYLLTNVIVNLTSLTFHYKDISPEIVLQLLRYPANWTEISTYTTSNGYFEPTEFFDQLEENGISHVEDRFQCSGWMIQAILRCCKNLEIFRMQHHEMDIDEIEQAPWACNDLKELRVRIKGLDTREAIEGVISRWRKGREQRKSSSAIKSISNEDRSIEARVTQHLLQFDKLSTVWLGSKLWKI